MAEVLSSTMPSVPKTKKSKSNRNIAGLQNQAKPSSTPSQHATSPQSAVPSPEDQADESDLEVDNEHLALNDS